MISGASKGKAMVEEKGKRTSHRIRIGMNFDPKTSNLRDQEKVDKYLASYEFRLYPGIKIEFCPNGADVFSAPPKKGGCIYAPPGSSTGAKVADDKVRSQCFGFLQSCSLSVVDSSLVHGSRV